MKTVVRYIIVMRKKLEGSGTPGTPAGKRLYADDSSTTTARHRATLFLDYELSGELDSWRCALGAGMFSIGTEEVRVPEGARTLGHETPANRRKA